MCTHKAHFWHIRIFSKTKKIQNLAKFHIMLVDVCCKHVMQHFCVQILRKMIYKNICNNTFALFFSFDPH